jgi:hypothetical protein
MAYRKISSGAAYTGTGNVIAEGPCIIKQYLIVNNGPNNVEVALRVGDDYATSKQLLHAVDVPPGIITSDTRLGGIALESGQQMFLDLLSGTGPLTAYASGLKE